MARMPWMAPVSKATATDRAEIARLLALSGRMSKRVQDAFLEEVDRAAGRIDTAEIVRLLRAGREAEAIREAARALTGANQSPLAEAITLATFDAAEDAARKMPAVGRARFEFDAINPKVVQRVESYSFNLIREINAEARRSIADVVRDGIRAGRNPLTVAQDIREHIGLTQRQTRAVLNYRRMLEDGDREAFRRALHSKNFDQEALKLLADKKPLPQKLIDRMVKQYQFRYLRYRSQVIARTEAIRAVNVGNHASWQQAVDEGVFAEDEVLRRWIYTHDDRVRDAHMLIPSMNGDGVVGLTAPFESILGPIRYPGDPEAPPENTIQCRCTVVLRYQPRRRAAA